MKLKFNLIILLCLSTSVFAETYTSKYIDEENRKIKSLSLDDITELKKGGGWGLAKVAELNGVPGPAHILEMGNKINLTDVQKKKIQKIHKKMKVEAVSLGKQLIDMEEELNNHFVRGTINQSLLEELVYKIENIRSKLRITHLSTHLQTPNILSSEQINLYNQLRGYSDDLCNNIPEDHNAKMWKKHNGCN